MVSSQLSELSLNSSTWMFKAGHSAVESFIYEFLTSFYRSSTQSTSQVGCLCGPWICPWFFSCYSCFYWCFHQEAKSTVKSHLQAYLKKKKILFLFCIQAEAISFLIHQKKSVLCILLSYFDTCAFSSFITVNGLEAEFVPYLCFIPCNSRQVTLCRVNTQ